MERDEGGAEKSQIQAALTSAASVYPARCTAAYFSATAPNRCGRRCCGMTSAPPSNVRKSNRKPAAATALIELVANPALTGFTAPKILWLREHEPKNYAKTKHILLPKDYIRYRMTGEYATEVSDASGTLLLDVVNRTWSDKLLGMLEIDTALLPRLHESPEITGYCTRGGRKEMGLKRRHSGGRRRRRSGGRRGGQRHRRCRASSAPRSAPAA